MTSEEVLKELQSLGQDSIRKVLLKHGISEPMYGVKIGDMKPLQKKIKKDYALSLELFASGIYDAMYFAGLIADETKITKSDLQQWVKTARSQGISEYTVPWIAAESRYGFELAIEWINAQEESVASSGWCTLSSLVAITQDKDLDITALKKLLKRIETDIHKSPNRVKMAMNGCVIAIGTYVAELKEMAKATGKKIGIVEVNVGDTACKVPSVLEYIAKAESRGSIGKKKKMARC